MSATPGSPGRPVMHRWSAIDRAAACQLAAAGMAPSEIARRMGRSRNAVIGLLHRVREAGDGLGDDPCALYTDDQLLQLLHLRERKAQSWIDIAAAVKIPPAQCSRAYYALRRAERQAEAIR